MQHTTIVALGLLVSVAKKLFIVVGTTQVGSSDLIRLENATDKL